MTSQTPAPYVGPRTFLETEDDRFFGRDTEARDLLALVVSERLVVFYAQSGAGKSSLVNTCLIRDLRKRGYRILKGRLIGDAPEGVQPGNIFVFNLLRSLAPKEVDSASLASLSISEFMLQHGKKSAAVNQASAGEEADSVALVIDQFEEIFSTHDDEWEKRSGFFEQLAQALEKEPYLSVVLVMREDFIASLDPYSALVPNRFRRRYYMQRLDHDAALDAIQKPVEKIRKFEEGVAERLVDDLSGIKIQIPGKDPITQPGQFVEAVQLQVACLKLWKTLGPGETITHADLDRLGDVNLALEEHYEDRVREVAKRKGVSERAIREWFGTKLITSNGARNMVLRETRKIEGQLGDDIIRDLLGDLVRMEPRGTASFYELTHDRLVEPIVSSNRKWFQSILERSSVLQQKTTLWSEQKKNETLLSTDDALVELERYAEKNPDEITELVREYLDACREKQKELNEHREAEHAKLELAQKLADEQARAAMWAKRYTAIFSTIAILAIVTSIWALNAGQDAKEKQNAAETAKAEAVKSQLNEEAAKKETERQSQIAQSGALITSASENPEQPDLAMLLTIEAYKADQNARTRREVLSSLQQFENLTGFIKPGTNNVVLDPNGNTLASLDLEGVTFWDIDTRQKINQTPINGHYNRVYPTAINPAGTILVSGSNDGSIVVWDLATRQPLTKPLHEHGQWIDSLIFTPDGKYLASSSDDQTIILWDMSNPESPRPVNTLTGHSGWIASLAMNSDGTILASGGNDSKIFLWDISNPEKAEALPCSPLTEHTSTVYSLAFAQDDNLLISGGADGSILLWDITDLEDVKPYENRIKAPDENAPYFYGLAPSPDGDTLAAGAGNSISFWDIRDPENPILIGEPMIEYDGKPINNSYIYSLVFLDENSLVTSSANDILLLNITDAEKPVELSTRFSSGPAVVNSLAYAPASHTLVSGNNDGSVAFWDVSTVRKPTALDTPQFRHPGRPESIYYDTFGTTLTSSGSDGSLLIDTASREVLGFSQSSPFLLGDSLQVVSYAKLGQTSAESRLYTIGKPEISPEIIPGNYLGADPSGTRIVYETKDHDGDVLKNVWDRTAEKAVLKNLTGDEFNFSSNGGAFILIKYDEEGNSSTQVWSTAGDEKLLADVDGYPITISANGKYLYYQPNHTNALVIAIFDLDTGQILDQTMDGFASGTSPDGRSIVIQDFESGRFTVLNADTFEPIGSPVRGSLHRFSSDGRFLIYKDIKAGVDYFGFMDTQTGLLIGSPVEGSFEELIPPGGNLLFHDYFDSTGQSQIGILDLGTGRRTIQQGNIYQYIPGQDRLIYIIEDRINGSYSLNLLNTSTGAQVGVPRRATFVALSPDNKYLVYTFQDSNYPDSSFLGVRDVKTGIDTASVPFAEFLDFNSEGQKIVFRTLGTDSVELGLLDPAAGQVTSTSSLTGDLLDYISQTNLAVTSSPNGLINLWDVSKDQLPGDEFVSPSPVNHAVLNPDKTILATIQGGEIVLKDTARDTLLTPPFNPHKGTVSNAIISPDSRFLLTSGLDGKAILWNFTTGGRLGLPFDGTGVGFSKDSKAILVLNSTNSRLTFYDTSTYAPIGNPVAASSISFSPDGKYFLVMNAGNNVTTLWDLASLAPITESLPGTYGTFSPRARFFAVGNGADDTLSIWTLESMNKIADSIEGASYEFSPDEKYLVSKNQNRLATVWRLTSISASGVSDLKKMLNNYWYFSDDGRYLYVQNDESAQLWDLYNLAKVPLNFGNGSPMFSPNGKFAAIPEGGKTDLWLLTSETRVSTDLPGGPPTFSPGGRYLAVSDYLNISFVDLMSLTKIKRQIPGSAVSFSPDDKFAAVLDDGKIKIVQLPALVTIKTFESDSLPGFTPDGRFLIHPDLVFDLLTRRIILEEQAANYNAEYSPDGRSLVIYGDGSLAIWNINSKELLTPPPGHTGFVYGLVFSPDGRYIASLSNDGIILSDAATGAPIGNTIPGSSIAFSPDGNSIAVSAENKTTLLHISVPAAPKPLGDELEGGQGMFSGDGRWIITADTVKNTTTVLDISSRTVIAQLTGTNPLFNSESNRLAVVNAGESGPEDLKGDKSKITILDFEVREIPLSYSCGANDCVKLAFNAGGNLLAYSDFDPQGMYQLVYIHDLENPEPGQEGGMKMKGTVSGLAFVPVPSFAEGDRPGEVLVVESSDQTFTLYDIDKRIPISKPISGDFIGYTLNGDVTRLIYKNNSNGNLMFWDFRPGEWLSQLCRKVSRNLTYSEWSQYDLLDRYHATCVQWPIDPELVTGK